MWHLPAGRQIATVPMTAVPQHIQYDQHNLVQVFIMADRVYVFKPHALEQERHEFSHCVGWDASLTYVYPSATRSLCIEMTISVCLAHVFHKSLITGRPHCWLDVC